MLAHSQVSAPPRPPLALMAWAVMLAVSVLPNALFHELAGAAPEWLTWAKIGLLAALAVITIAWRALRPLRNFGLVLLAMFCAEEAVRALQASALWRAWWGGPEAAFTASMGGAQAGRLLVTVAMIVVLLALGYRRADCYLTAGQVAAPVEPVRWLGFRRPGNWRRFGTLWTVGISLGLLVFLLVGGRPSAAALWGAARWLPAIVLFAGLNAFSEEVTYRATLLATLAPAVGQRQALWNAALFFGLGHYFGVPYGVVGVLMAGFLGWLLGKAMLETRGLFWAWLIHCVQDVLIFSFMAAGSITPGGA